MVLLHTMIRVIDLQKTIDFYTNVLDMKLIRTTDRPEQEYTLAFLGYGDGKSEIELTFNYGKKTYSHGDAFGHLAFGVNDIEAVCNKAGKYHGKVVREPGPVKGGITVIAFLEDPNGYKIELIKI